MDERELLLAITGIVMWYATKKCNLWLTGMGFDSYRKCIEHYTDEILGVAKDAGALSEEQYRFIKDIVMRSEEYCEEHEDELCRDVFKLARFIAAEVMG